VKRIAFFGIKTFPSQGGTDRVAENIILQLKDNYAITVYCFKNPAAKHNIPEVKVVEFRRWAPGAMGSLIYFFFSALHLFFLNSVDLVHIHKTESTLFAPLLRIRYKVIATSHEAQYKSDKWKGFKLFFHLAERMYIYSANVCTCISQPLTRYYEKRYSRKVRFIPNGINLVKPEAFDVEGAKSVLPAGASLDKPFILFSARRLMRIKGGHTMLKALHKVKYEGQVFITGELNNTDDHLRELRKLSAGLNVFFLGFVNSLPALLALIDRSDLFIFPSETEGMSIMLLEVASVGRPIIASDIPENKQVFGNNEVLYFTSKDSDDLAEKLTFAFNNPDVMKQIGLEGQKKVILDYQWPNVAKLYDTVYQEVVGSK
jgi:glycosyltransferase involved in cell wall biosynthesis